MQKIMQKHAGVFRKDVLLEEGVKRLNALYKEMDSITIQDKTRVFNTEYVEYLELVNLMDNALVTMEGANFRKESRGAHSRVDFPKRDDKKWHKHLIVDSQGKMYKRAVNMNPSQMKAISLSKRDH